MPVKCRSCGYVNKDNTKHCERCSIDLRYSKIFEKAAQENKENSKFLFEIADSEDNFDDNELIDINEEQDLSLEQLTNSEDDNYHEVDYPEPDYQTGYEDQFTHEEMIEQRTQKSSSELSHFYRDSIKVVFVHISIEIMIMMLMFTLFYFLTKLIFPHITMSNWKILLVSIIYYSFITSYALSFNGAFISHRVFDAISFNSKTK